MEPQINLFQIIGKQQVEIEMLKAQLAALTEALKEKQGGDRSNKA